MWAQAILAGLCITVGVICAIIALIISFANGFGGATNAGAVNYRPALLFVALAVAFIAGGITLLP